jgi:hypothetical protein
LNRRARRKEWFELLPADARRAWARRYALSPGAIDENSAEKEAVEKEAADQQYDVIARLIAASVAQAERASGHAGRLGQKGLDDAGEIKQRVQDAELEAARHRSRAVIFRVCDPAYGADPRTRLLVALEILGATSTPATPQTPARVMAPTSPSTTADTGVSDYDPLRELKSSGEGASRASSRWTYVPEAEQVAYRALSGLQAERVTDPQGGLPSARRQPSFTPVELSAPTPHLGRYGAMQLEFGRIGALRETLFFATSRTARLRLRQ